MKIIEETSQDVTARNSIEQKATDLLQDRQYELRSWIMENAPECLKEQRHLDAGTAEQTYWHYGYLMALRDMLALFGSASTPRH